MRILVTDGMDKAAQARMAENNEVVNQFYESNELGTALREFDVVIIRSKTKIRKQQIDEAKGSQLKVIIRAGVGVDNIDVAYAEENGIKVMNTPKASSQSVAELALAHMFSCARFVADSARTMVKGEWNKAPYSKGVELSGKTLGIIGFGRIGQKLCTMVKGIGMNVIAYDIYHIPGIEEEMGMKYVEMDELFAQSDFISLHTPSVDGKPLICEENIAKMKDGVIFVNTSRGNNVDEDALLKALDSGKIFAAGVDVFAAEPNTNSALASHSRVSCTPHIGGATVESQSRIGAELVDIVAGL